MRNGFLVALNGETSGPLALMIRNASNGGAGGALRVRSGEEAWSNLLISPLPPKANFPQSGSRSLVAFRMPGTPAPLDARLFMSAFGLSRVEAQVAIGLMEGRSLDEVALGRGVRPSTIKTQLKAIFEKTGTHSQRDLVRLLGSLPPVRMT